MRKLLILVGSCLILMVIIGFASNKNSSRPIHDVIVNIKDQEGNYFIDKPEVLALLNAQNTDYVLGLAIGEVDLKLLERRLEIHSFVKDAQVFYDIKGNLQVNIEQANPIARIYRVTGEDQYIDDQGEILPINTKHTARVPLVEIELNADWVHNLNQTISGERIFELLSYINQDPIWKAQIAHLIIDKGEEITMIPQVTKQRILFGKAENIEDKFERLTLFYKDILPSKGWNTYELVNLKFENQIVCR